MMLSAGCTAVVWWEAFSRVNGKRLGAGPKPGLLGTSSGGTARALPARSAVVLSSEPRHFRTTGRAWCVWPQIATLCSELISGGGL